MLFGCYLWSRFQIFKIAKIECFIWKRKVYLFYLRILFESSSCFSRFLIFCLRRMFSACSRSRADSAIFGFFGGADTETESTPVLFTAEILFLSNRGLNGFWTTLLSLYSVVHLTNDANLNAKLTLSTQKNFVIMKMIPNLGEIQWFSKILKKSWDSNSQLAETKCYR